MDRVFFAVLVASVMAVFGFVRMWYNPGQHPVLAVFLILLVGGIMVATIAGWKLHLWIHKEHELPRDPEMYNDHGTPVP